MIKIKDLENYFEKSFDELLNDNDIIVVADDIKGAWGDYRSWELKYCYDNEDKKVVKEYLNSLNESWQSREFDETIVRVSQIEAKILSVDGVLDVNNATVNSSTENLVLDFKTIPVFGGVTINV